jgi:trans-feruloyl-CoA hydratase/vanillin synthase
MNATNGATPLPGYSTILVERADGVTTISFNRPEKRNAMNPTLHDEMLDVLDLLERDPETAVVVITGSGSAFSAGMDLKEYFRDLESDQSMRDRYRRIATEWSSTRLRMYPKPTIAMVNGYCFGGAFTIVASCDIAVAADEAVFGLSEVNVGYMPGGMVAASIASLMPYRDAVYYAMTGEQFDGRRAAEIRFVTRSVPAERLRREVETIADRLKELDPAAIRASKESVKQVIGMSTEQAAAFLAAKHNDLNWRHQQAGHAGEGVDRFVAKQYKPGVSSYTQAAGEK